MTSKGRKATVLKHWFGIDQVLFGKKLDNELSENDRKMYLSTKAALLSNLFEIYTKLNYSPKVNHETIADMIKESMVDAKDARNRSKQLLENVSVTKLVKEEISELGELEGLSEEQVARYVVARRHHAVSIDSMVLEDHLKHANKTNLNDWSGKVLIDSHKTLRDSLIDLVLQ